MSWLLSKVVAATSAERHLRDTGSGGKLGDKFRGHDIDSANDDLGRLAATQRANGAWSYYGFGGTPWLTELHNDPPGTAADLSITLQRNTAGQIVQRSGNNESYSWAQGYNVQRDYQSNALNQYTGTSYGTTNALTFQHDPRGNMTASLTPQTGGSGINWSSTSYGYDIDNQLTSRTVGGATATLGYDYLGRLSNDVETSYVSGTQTGQARSFGYGGDRLLVEKDAQGNTTAHYVYGVGEAPIVWYNGSGSNDPRWLLPDERGSVMAVTGASGNLLRANTYDEFGIPGSNNLGRFGYTGQAWNTSLGMWYYKARIYSPTLGRFMQTDPIGYADGLNWYNYVGGDPINKTDPSGLRNDGKEIYGQIINCCMGLDDIVGIGGLTERLDLGLLQLQFQNFFRNLGTSSSGSDLLSLLADDATQGAAPQSGHNYDTTEQVCRVPLSQDQRGLINRATAVPDGTINGSRSAGTYPVGGWLFGIIPTIGGYVTTRFSADANIAVNTTTGAHLFVGTITRTIYSNTNGTFIRTVGSGNAGSGIVGRTRDAINDAAGPGIFRDANGLSRTVAKQLNPSC